jgi:hypothetical protein
MPSTSKKQHNFMAAVANNPEFAKKAGVPKSVGEDFMQADKGIKLKSAQQSRPDLQKINTAKTNHGKSTLFNKGGVMKKIKEGGKTDIAQDKAMVKKALRMHDAQEHKGGKGTDLSKLKKGGMPKMAAGGTFRSSANGVAEKGLTRAMMPKMKGKTI